jgi:hypothetical protein
LKLSTNLKGGSYDEPAQKRSLWSTLNFIISRITTKPLLLYFLHPRVLLATTHEADWISIWSRAISRMKTRHIQTFRKCRWFHPACVSWKLHVTKKDRTMWILVPGTCRIPYLKFTSISIIPTYYDIMPCKSKIFTSLLNTFTDYTYNPWLKPWQEDECMLQSMLLKCTEDIAYQHTLNVY